MMLYKCTIEDYSAFEFFIYSQWVVNRKPIATDGYILITNFENGAPVLASYIPSSICFILLKSISVVLVYV